MMMINRKSDHLRQIHGKSVNRKQNRISNEMNNSGTAKDVINGSRKGIH